MLDKIVVDTNIWISALITSSGNATKLINEWKKNSFNIIVSEEQMMELTEVLKRPKFLNKYEITEHKINDLILSIIERAERITLKNDIKLCRDPDDDILIETAIRGKAKYLISGDKDITDIASSLLQYDITVLSVANFLKIIVK